MCIRDRLYGKSLSQLSTEELQQRYKIPFVIWANYDIESQDDLKTSPNYLSDLLLDTANVPKNEIENFTSEVRNDVPQINAMGQDVYKRQLCKMPVKSVKKLQ